MNSNINAPERTKKEAIMKYFADAIKIDIGLMNKKDHENMDMHIDNILKLKSSNDLYERVVHYVKKEKDGINQTFFELKEIEVIKKENKSAISKAENQAIEDTMKKFLEIRPEQFRKEGRIRKKYIDEMWRKLWITNICRKLYRFDVVLEHNTLKVRNFSIEDEAVREHDRSL